MKDAPKSAIVKVESALKNALWPCCDSCKYVTYDGCKLGDRLGYGVIDNSVRVVEGYLCCTFWREAES